MVSDSRLVFWLPCCFGFFVLGDSFLQPWSYLDRLYRGVWRFLQWRVFLLYRLFWWTGLSYLLELVWCGIHLVRCRSILDSQPCFFWEILWASLLAFACQFILVWRGKVFLSHSLCLIFGMYHVRLGVWYTVKTVDHYFPLSLRGWVLSRLSYVSSLLCRDCSAWVFLAHLIAWRCQSL